MKTPQQMVDDIVRNGARGWTAPTPRHVDYDGDPNVDWSAEWRRLKTHHEKECDILMAVIRELADRLAGKP